jgi:hypothetical protein
MFALVSYGTAVSQLAPLIVITLAMLILIGAFSARKKACIS